MISAYKAGGDWKTKDGQAYTVKSVNKLPEGYFASLEEALKSKPKKVSAKKAVETKAETKDLLGE